MPVRVYSVPETSSTTLVLSVGCDLIVIAAVRLLITSKISPPDQGLPSTDICCSVCRQRFQVLKDDQSCLRELAKNAIHLQMLIMTVKQGLQSYDCVTGRSVSQDLYTFLCQLFMRDNADRLPVFTLDDQTSIIVKRGI